MEGACVNLETGDDLGASSEEEETDYINLTVEQNVQVVDSTEDDEADYENVTKDEQVIYIYGETDFTYQNVDRE